jgi:hypothetical protein
MNVPVTVYPYQPAPPVDFSDLLELEDPIDLYSFLEGESRSGTCTTPTIEEAFVPAILKDLILSSTSLGDLRRRESASY